MNRLLVLLAMVFAQALFCVACGDGNADAPQPRPASDGVFVPLSSISEAQMGEAKLKIGPIKNALQACSISPKYNRDLNKLSRDVNGKMDAAKWAILALDPASFDGAWYTASDFAIDYAGNGKFIITIGELNTPRYIREEVTVR